MNTFPTEETAGKIGPSARELEVLELICEGCSGKEIAYRLGISPRTAASHRSRLFAIARVSSAVLLFRWAIEHGYVCWRTAEKPEARTLDVHSSSQGRSAAVG